MMIRPTSWEDYIGQNALKTRLKVHINAAFERLQRIDHVMLIGPAGCGKTTLAGVIANELNFAWQAYKMPLKERALKQVVLEQRGIVFFDEIHRCSPKEQEFLLPLLEDGYIQTSDGVCLQAGELFTVIAATTEPQKLIKPLWDRFPIKPSFEEYTENQMTQIIRKMGKNEDLDISEKTARLLAKATGGIPRKAYDLVVIARDLGIGLNRPASAQEILSLGTLTPTGLNQDQMKYLKILRKSGGSAGLEVLATHLQLSRSVLMDYERMLLDQDLITYTKQGRELTGKGYEATKGG